MFLEDIKASNMGEVSFAAYEKHQEGLETLD
jgi:hypothetical protein